MHTNMHSCFLVACPILVCTYRTGSVLVLLPQANISRVNENSILYVYNMSYRCLPFPYRLAFWYFLPQANISRVKEKQHTVCL
jgi:hypothetical protein